MGNALTRRRVAAGIAVAFAILLFVGVVRALSGFSLADDTTSPWSPDETFKQTLSVMPRGTRLYWRGPSSAGYRLGYVSLRFEGDVKRHGTEIQYGGSKGTVYVNTYAGSRRPTADYDVADDTSRRVVIRMTTATNQIVLVTCWRSNRCASSADIERIRRDLRPVAAADIDQLPDDWSEIPA